MGSLLLMLSSVAATAADTAVIRGIEISGNGRTDAGFIERTLGVSPGDRFDPESVPVLEQRLTNLRLFKSVHVEPVVDGDDGVVLRVAVDERWSLIPVPVFGASRGVVGGGLFLIESNLFGRGKQLAAGAFVTNRGTTASVGYRDPGVGGSRLLFTADFSRADMMREQDAGMTTVYQFQDLRYEYGATLGWRLTDRLSLRGGWFSLLVDATPIPGFAPPPRAPPVRGLSGEVELNADDYHLWHVTGFSARLRYRQGVSWLASDRNLYQASARVSWARRAFADHALTLSGSFDSSRGDPIIDALRLGGVQGSRGFLRGGLWADTAGTFTAEYQVPVWHPSWGVLTWATFVDAGLTRWQGTATNYVASGVGVRMYLRNIAVPAIGFDVAQATGVSSPAFSFVAGWRY